MVMKQLPSMLNDGGLRANRQIMMRRPDMQRFFQQVSLGSVIQGMLLQFGIRHHLVCFLKFLEETLKIFRKMDSRLERKFWIMFENTLKGYKRKRQGRLDLQKA